MRDAFVYSVLFHVFVVAISYFGLPHLARTPSLLDTPIMVDIVNVDELTNAPPPAPKKVEKKVEPKEKKKASPPPKPPRQASPPPPPAKEPEVAALPPEPEPKPEVKKKEEPKPEPKAKPAPKPEPRLIKAKPRRKPKPPDAFASVLKTVEKLKKQPRPTDKDDDKKKKKEKAAEKPEDLEQMVAKALSSRPAHHDPSRPLAISEIDLVRQQIYKCWNVPAGAKGAENLSIEIGVVMNPDGTVREARIRDQARLHSDAFFRAAAESALRAVLNPRCNPLKLPPDKYQQWQTMTLNFDPRYMF